MVGERKRVKDVRLEMLQDNSSLARNKIAEHLLSLNILNEGDKTDTAVKEEIKAAVDL